MADKRITELNPLSGAALDGDVDVLAVADVSASETKKITPSALIAGSVGVLPDGTIPGSKIQLDSLAGNRLLENTITSRELGPDSVGTVHVIDGAITNAKLAGDISGDKLEDGAIGTQQLGTDSVDGGVHIKARSIPADRIVQNSLTAEEISPNAIGSSELADGAVDTTALQDDACSTPKYQNASVTNEKLASGIDGSKLIDGSVPGSKIEPGSITGNSLDQVPLSKLPDAGPNTVLAGPNGGVATTPSYRALVPADLPTASTTAKGGVSVPSNGGLAVNGSGAVSISNTVNADGFPFVNYNSNGLITSGRPLSGDDLPPPALGQIGGVKPGNGLATTADGTLNVVPATDTSIGGVIAGNGITIAGDGKISQSLTGVTAGQYTKVTVDAMGSVTAAELLSPTDIPNISWDQIDNPAIDGSQILNKTVQRQNLADYATSFIQEDLPAVDQNLVPIGCLWFQESTANLNMWNGNSFMSVGIGRLSSENLRYCGLVDASTAKVTAVTQFGVTEGFEVGDAIPEPTDELTGVYFLVEVPGSGIDLPAVSGQTFDEGDWVVCNGVTTGWKRIDAAAGGGGGGAARLEDLLDVDVSTKQPGALFQYQSDGKWKDIYAIDAGTY